MGVQCIIPKVGQASRLSIDENKKGQATLYILLEVSVSFYFLGLQIVSIEFLGICISQLLTEN